MNRAINANSYPDTPAFYQVRVCGAAGIVEPLRTASSVAPGHFRQVALTPHFVDGQDAAIQQGGFSLHAAVFVLLQRFDHRQVELHGQLRIAQAGQQYPVELFLQKPHLGGTMVLRQKMRSAACTLA